jgi:hypothetical protein
MKIIFSKKGFDSTFGKMPSPIFPDGSMITLPIPDDHSNYPYAAISSPHPAFPTMEKLLLALGCKENVVQGMAHLDPDLLAGAKPRRGGWRPVLGQSGSALGHLIQNGVGVDDIFLFYGLFQEVLPKPDGNLSFTGKKQQVIWGWLQVAEIHYVHEIFGQREYVWLNDHPHLQACTRKDDAIFMSRDSLRLPSVQLRGVPGAGIFGKCRPELTLSYPEGKSFTNWRLPKFFYPFPGKTPLTYHNNKDRWRKKNGYCYLDRVAIGQEFVLHDEYMPDLGDWLHVLFEFSKA